jgi:hemolysin III
VPCAIAYGGEIHSRKEHAMSSLRARPAVPAAIELGPATIPSAEFRGRAYSFVATQTQFEELANTWSAAVGVAGACGFALALLWHGDATLGQWVFAVALLILFLTSTAYHGLVAGPAKELARILDHVAIFALIAATYTPFAFGPLYTHGGVLLFVLEWGLAVIGLCFVLCGGHDSMRISNALYIAMGWLGLFFFSDFIACVPMAGNWLILAGGVFYTAGVAFYSARELRFSHLIWHLFVLAGAICHAVAVYAYSGWLNIIR